MRFGAVLRQLRAQTGIGIKKLAPRLGVSYSYLSKLENDEVGPSEDLVGRVAKYFRYDRNRLLLSAGKVPQEILDILRDNPDQAIQFLRERFGRRAGALSLDPQTEKLLEMIEAQAEVGGRFEKIRRCGLDGGNGSFSLIFEAEDKQQSNRKVALKFLHPFERDQYRIRCFQREPEVLALAVGHRDIIELVAPRGEFSVVLQPVGFPIPFAYYALELASTDLGFGD